MIPATVGARPSMNGPSCAPTAVLHMYVLVGIHYPGVSGFHRLSKCRVTDYRVLMPIFARCFGAPSCQKTRRDW